jgi:hypothetical protein
MRAAPQTRQGETERVRREYKVVPAIKSLEVNQQQGQQGSRSRSGAASSPILASNPAIREANDAAARRLAPARSLPRGAWRCWRLHGDGLELTAWMLCACGANLWLRSWRRATPRPTRRVATRSNSGRHHSGSPQDFDYPSRPRASDRLGLKMQTAKLHVQPFKATRLAPDLSILSAMAFSKLGLPGGGAPRNLSAARGLLVTLNRVRMATSAVRRERGAPCAHQRVYEGRLVAGVLRGCPDGLTSLLSAAVVL